MLAHRALVFPVTSEDPGLGWLLAEFRLLVNESIRIALREDIRGRLSPGAVRDLRGPRALSDKPPQHQDHAEALEDRE